MSAYLRPFFTASLAEALLAGQCINLISAHGQGRRRTLQDLHHALPDSLQIFYINMRTHKADYKGFLNKISMQHSTLKCKLKNFNSILDKIERGPGKNLLILHNFDELRCIESLNCGYNIHLFQALNSIKHRGNIALLCVSECTFDHYLLQADGTGLAHSNLDAESMYLPSITYDQILAELRLRNFQLPEKALQQLASSLLDQPTPYSALESLKL